MKFSNSYEVIKRIEQKKRNGIALRQLKAFMESLNNPHLQLRCIHIGGTNGKGSTTNVVASVLKEAGYKVGMFTSPYLETHHDRIRINHQFISDEAIVAYANKYYEQWVAYDLSMFEIDMFIATMYFIENKVDFAVFEVGLGGEQDATNIIDPIVSAITNIGLDHMEYLGNSYESIAKAKAGIIKQNRALITSEKKECCLAVFKQVCRKKNCLFIQCDTPCNICVKEELVFDYKQFHDIHQPTLASYQANNTSLAIEILQYLKQHQYIQLTNEKLYQGIQKAIWKGRFEVVCKKPKVIVDGAHNNEGIDALVASAQSLGHVKVLFTALKDKPNHKMLEKLLTLTDDVTVCEFAFYRAEKAINIANGYPVKVIEDYQEAIDTLMSSCQEQETLLICGSLYFITLAREYILCGKENTEQIVKP
ncbi:MAG: bifunctional folylpolyglutamate synthase/dihydrofolate synthase [Erysipelotrichia bacterium]|nr:bifunctional folylpolyglutamate synthase/dihydrofolate synthase [Erysipelotrichia bacterium]NCC54830.1 bifunctional folylpolyglutamate synthase/dihydrofolate synthase [Erysipelotrichia bacterium]